MMPTKCDRCGKLVYWDDLYNGATMTAEESDDDLEILCTKCTTETGKEVEEFEYI